MNYRPEIDGLRAVAVLPVILFHAGIGPFAGGYVGVDVFFVLSGYLITAILLAEMRLGTFTFAGFYERRARRILPALFVVMAVTIPLAWVLMLPALFQDYARSLGLAAVSLSNFYFLRTTGYFGSGAELQPLLHTWSLGVEEQYYLLFPPLLLVLWRWGPRALLGGVVVLTLASLAVAVWGAGHDPARNFYFTPSRFWELGAGSLCALAIGGQVRRPHAGLAALGLALILAAILTFDADTPTPGPWTVMPVLGAVLVVLFAGPGTGAAWALSWRPLVAVGLISYSAYLWHQPLFAFARLASLHPPSPWLMGALAVLTMGLAWATWAWVEQPVRRRPTPWLAGHGRLFGAAGVGIALAVAFGVLADNSAFVMARLSPDQRALLAWSDFARTATFRAANLRPHCFTSIRDDGAGAFRPDLCLTPDPVRPNILLMGDSHAAHLAHGLRAEFPGAQVLQMTLAGCRMLRAPTGGADCGALSDRFWQTELPALRGQVQTVVLAGRWRQADLGQIAPTVAALHGMGFAVLVVGAVPEFHPDIPVLLARLPSGADADRAAARARLTERVVIGNAVAAEVRGAGAPLVDAAAVLCAGDRCRTRADGGDPLIWDYGHFTPQGSRTVVRLLLAGDTAFTAAAAGWR